MWNTKNIIEIEAIQNALVERWGLTLSRGIFGGRINLEDGLPWLEIDGDLNKEKAQLFAQEMANEMNVRVLFNRLCIYPEDSTLYLVLDISPDVDDVNDVVPPYTTDEDEIEYINGYGQEFLPQ